MTETQIKHMVDRFLGWKLPDSFNPDAGISFKKTFNEHTAHPMKHEPSGTNLFDADQADAMVRYMIDGMPAASNPHEPIPAGPGVVEEWDAAHWLPTDQPRLPSQLSYLDLRSLYQAALEYRAAAFKKGADSPGNHGFIERTLAENLIGIINAIRADQRAKPDQKLLIEALRKRLTSAISLIFASRRFVNDAGSDEDPEAKAGATKLVGEIDEWLNGPAKQ